MKQNKALLFQIEYAQDAFITECARGKLIIKNVKAKTFWASMPRSQGYIGIQNYIHQSNSTCNNNKQSSSLHLDDKQLTLSRVSQGDNA